jgi:plastocyanin
MENAMEPEKQPTPPVQPTPEPPESGEPSQPDEHIALPTPEPTSTPQLGSSRKKLAVIAVAVSVVLLLSAALVFAQTAGDDQKQETVVSTDQSSDTTQPETAAPTSPETATETPTTTNQQPTTTGGTVNPAAPVTTPTPTPTPAPATPKTHTMSYTNNCYSPVNLTIKKGDTVRFVNDSTKKMWPASDNHPSHTKYSEFDSDGSIDPGGTYSFTFTKTGAWGYHDHQRSSCSGTITVQ